MPMETTTSTYEPASISRASMSSTVTQQQQSNKEGSVNWSNQQMTVALQAIKEGMSFYEAASSFNIPLATLHGTAKRRGITSRQAITDKSYSDQQMTVALEAIKAGLGVTKAAYEYNIAPSTLRRHTEQHGIKIPIAEPSWTEEQMRQALEAIQGGMLWTTAATMFKIPYATLFKRGKRCGVTCPKPDSKEWSQEQMDKALQAIQDGMSFRKAETVFNIPHGTIYQRAKLSGIFRPKVTVKRTKNDSTRQQLHNALEAIEGGMTYEEAAATYKVPRSTLRAQAKRKATSQGDPIESQANSIEISDTTVPNASCVKIEIKEERDGV